MNVIPAMIRLLLSGAADRVLIYGLPGLIAIIAFFAHAQSATGQAAPFCDVSTTSLSFGIVDVTTNASFDSTATMDVTCTSADVVAETRVCISLGPGSGGHGGPGQPRFLQSGAMTLAFDLYKDASRTSQWGSFEDGSMGATGFEVVVPAASSGSSSAPPIPVYARIAAGQRAASAGVYLSDFAGLDARINWGATAQFPTCDAVMAETSSTQFTVRAEIIPTCRVSATVLDFGSVGNLDDDVDGTATIATTCTNGHPYTVGLNGGIGSGASVEARAMTGPGGTVGYGLFHDSARSRLWGNTIGADTASGSGTGSAQQMTVHGRIPSQVTPSSGAYVDTVTVIVTY